jgi:hypothetical protein
VVGSKEAVRLVGVGRPVHMVGMEQEDIQPEGIGWSWVEVGDMHRGMKQQQQLVGQCKDTHQQERMQREVFAGHTAVPMAVLSGVHMRYNTSGVSSKNERLY